MRKVIIIVLFIFSVMIVKSQQAVMFSQYYTNNVIYNPLISGSLDYSAFTFQSRQQWLGFEGAPLSANVELSWSFK